MAKKELESEAAPAVIAVDSITTEQKGDNPEQTRLRGVFKRYFEENPERVSWEEVKADMMNQIARAGDVTE